MRKPFSDLDTVKTISFLCKDSLGNTISHSVNQLELLVSKRYGMLKSLNFLTFPNDTSYLLLASHNNLSSGIKNLKWKEIYDFEVGDEFHTHEYISGIPFQSDTYEKKIILSKINTQSSWIYTVDREYYLENYQGDTLYLRDTLTEIYPFYHYSDTISLKELFTCDGFGNCSGVHWSLNYSNNYQQVRKIYDNNYYNYFLVGDTCLTVFLGSSIPDTFYLAGLGGGYYHAAGSGSYDNRILEYYKKGSTTWGNPIDFGLYNEVQNIKIETKKLEVFPNPSTESIHVNLPEKLREDYLLILDGLGQLVMKKKLENIQEGDLLTLNIGDWTNGVYIIQIQTENAVWLNKIVKK